MCKGKQHLILHKSVNTICIWSWKHCVAALPRKCSRLQFVRAIPLRAVEVFPRTRSTSSCTRSASFRLWVSKRGMTARKAGSTLQPSCLQLWQRLWKAAVEAALASSVSWAGVDILMLGFTLAVFRGTLAGLCSNRRSRWGTLTVKSNSVHVVHWERYNQWQRVWQQHINYVQVRNWLSVAGSLQHVTSKINVSSQWPFPDRESVGWCQLLRCNDSWDSGMSQHTLHEPCVVHPRQFKKIWLKFHRVTSFLVLGRLWNSLYLTCANKTPVPNVNRLFLKSQCAGNKIIQATVFVLQHRLMCNHSGKQAPYTSTWSSTWIWVFVAVWSNTFNVLTYMLLQ